MPILVIDDAQEMLLLLKAFLQRAGYHEVLTAGSFDEALPKLAERDAEGRCPIDLILLDLMMPGVNGIEACRRFRADHALEDVPIIVVTAQGGSEHLEEAFQAGAMDFIRKPIDRVELLARMRSALRLKRELETIREQKRKLVELTHQLSKANEILERQTTIDELTGIANRRCFDEVLQRELRRGARKGVPVSLLMMDIDHFKAFNDTYGHLAGDDCLTRVAQAISQQVWRPGDLTARYGGEEFAVILSETPLEGALTMAERIRQAIVALALPHPASSTSDVVTLSVGVASVVPTPQTTPEDLIGEADRALYEAKGAGRNCSRPLALEREVTHAG